MAGRAGGGGGDAPSLRLPCSLTCCRSLQANRDYTILSVGYPWKNPNARGTPAHARRLMRPRSSLRDGSSDSVPVSASQASTSAPDGCRWSGEATASSTPSGVPATALQSAWCTALAPLPSQYEALVAAGYRVFVPDLLGQGRSEKTAVPYSMELWVEQLADFLGEVVGVPAVLRSNWLAGGAHHRQPHGARCRAGLNLVNCACGMNNKAIAGCATPAAATHAVSVPGGGLLPARIVARGSQPGAAAVPRRLPVSGSSSGGSSVDATA